MFVLSVRQREKGGSRWSCCCWCAKAQLGERRPIAWEVPECGSGCWWPDRVSPLLGVMGSAGLGVSCPKYLLAHGLHLVAGG